MKQSRPIRQSFHRMRNSANRMESLEQRNLLTAVAIVEHVVAAPQLDSSQVAQVADVDGDGDLDAVALSGSQLATFVNQGEAVFINEGEEFASPILTEEVASDFRSLLLEDFDGDGVVEAIAGGGASDDADPVVSLYENDGAGNFTFAKTLLSDAEGDFVDDMEVGDFNGDGQLDAIAVDRGDTTGQVVLLTNAGNGEFTSSVISNTYTEPRSALAVDLDNDDDQDLVVSARNVRTVVDEGGQEVEVTEYILFVMTNDNGVLTETGDPIATADEPRYMSFGDFDGNGFQDVVVPQQESGVVSVFYNNAGVISNEDQFNVDEQAPSPERTAVADANGDGILDILITNDERQLDPLQLNSILFNDQEAGNFLAYYPGLGDGTFAEAQLISYVREGSGLALGDLDGDNSLDIVTTSQFASQVQIHLNEGGGAYQTEELTSVPVFEPEAALPADIDGDGDLDVVGMSDKYEISWYANDGEGNFGDANVIDLFIRGPQPLQYFWFDIQTADIDGDGDTDVIATIPFGPDLQVLLYENDGTGAFPVENQQSLSLADSGSLEVRILDFDGDEDMDFITAEAFENSISLYTRGADGSYEREILFQAALGFADFEVGDLDADGDQDIVLGIDGDQAGSSVVIFENFGVDGFDQVDILLSAQILIADVGMADIDGDGDLDVTTAAYNFEPGGTDILWFENTGQPEDARFPEVGNTIGNQPFLKDMREVDVDGDGDLDLLTADRVHFGIYAVTNEALGQIEWYENTGGGVFAEQSHGLGEAEFDLGTYIGFGDLTGDGVSDILVPVGFEHEIRYMEVIPLDFVGDDNTLNIDDVHALCGDIQAGSNSGQFDLNRDGVVDNADMTIMLESGFDTVVGDSDLNGSFGTADFVKVFQAGEYEDGVPNNSNWATGDWNCDGEFDSGDFVYVFELDTFDPEAGVVAARIGSETIEAVNQPNQDRQLAGALDGQIELQQDSDRKVDLTPQTIDRIFSEI